MFRKTISLVLLSSILTLNSYAICEREREGRDAAEVACKRWLKASEGCAFGGLLAAAYMACPPVGLVALAPGMAAHHSCQLRDQWQSQLNACETYHQYMAKMDEKNKRDLAFMREKLDQYMGIYWSWDKGKLDIVEKYEKLFEIKTQEERIKYEREGYNVNSRETMFEIKQKLKPLEDQMEKEMKDLERKAGDEIKAKGLLFVTAWFSFCK
jgi:hypothetical protein